MTKPEQEFTAISVVQHTPCAGDVPGLTEQILAQNSADAGVATRILHFAPNTDTTPNGVQKHDFWEEVYILEGSFTDLRLGQTFVAGEFACRPPGMEHGPWVSGAEGCITFEVRYHST